MTPIDAWRASLEASTVTGTAARTDDGARRLPALSLAAHPDADRVGERVALPALASGRGVALSRTAPAFVHPGSAAEPRPLADPRLSRRPLRLEPLGGGGVRIVRGDHGGEVEVDGAPLAEACDLDAERLAEGAVILLARRVALLFHTVLPAPPPAGRRLGLVGDSDAVWDLRREVGRLSALAVPVLLRGETGTGKELVARAIHDAGPRRDRPYLALNMAAIPAALAAAELFGADRGAFTGAERRRPGYFRRATGGTLFLDEVGAAPGEVQDLLLRVLESGEIQPVGGEPERVDVRVISATDADLEAAVAAGEFRAPLLHRLAGWEVRLAPLRRRRDDVARLLLFFLRQELAAVGAERLLADPGPSGEPWLPAPLVARLVAAPWPGNVRQLRNVARKLVVGGHDRDRAALTPELERQLAPPPAAVSAPPAAPAPAPAPAETPPAPQPAPKARRSYRRPDEVADDELLAALRANRWRLQPAAEALGVSRTSLYALIDRCPAIRKAADLGRDEVAAYLKAAGGDVDEAAAELEVSRHGLLLRLRELGL